MSDPDPLTADSDAGFVENPDDQNAKNFLLETKFNVFDINAYS